MMKNIIVDIPNLPNKIKDAFINRDLVVFIGAGISRLVGCKSWEDMANELVSKICKYSLADQIINNTKLDSKAKITIAKRYAEKDNCMELFWEIFHDAITPKCFENDNIYSTIGKLGSGIMFITTNCDGLLVKRFPHSYTTNCNQNMYLEKENETYVFCIHGNYNDDKSNLVFTVDEYLKAYSPKSELSLFLETVLQKKTVLFLGYGLNEFEIISKAFSVNEDISIKHYLLEGFFDYQYDLMLAQKEYFNSLGVELIPYNKEKRGYKQQINIIEKWVDELIANTPFISRGIEEAIKVLDDFSDGNRKYVKSIFMRDDEIAMLETKAILEQLPNTNLNLAWCSYLIEEGAMKVEDLPFVSEEKNMELYPKSEVLNCLTRCISSSIEEKDELVVIRSFIERCIDYVLKTDVLNNIGVVEGLIELCFKLKIQPKSDTWRLWEKWIENSNDRGFIFINNYFHSMKNWDHNRDIELIKMFYGNSNNNGIIWFSRVARKIKSEFQDEKKEMILMHISKILVENMTDHPLHSNFHKQLQFYKNSYVNALFTSLLDIEDSLSNEGKMKYCDYLLGINKSTFTWQLVLYFFKKEKRVDCICNSDNPLCKRNTFEDFYFWLESSIDNGLLDSKIAKEIFCCIDNATFGVKNVEKNRINRNRIIINTLKYQLISLLERYDNSFCVEKNKISIYDPHIPLPKTSENNNLLYWDSESRLSKVKIDDLSNEDIRLFVNEIINKETGVFYEAEKEIVFDELFDTMSEERLKDYTDYMLGLPLSDSIAFITSLKSDKYIKKARSEHHFDIINRLMCLAIDDSNSNQIRSKVANTIAFFLKKSECDCSEKFEFARGINIDYLCRSQVCSFEDMNWPTLILNNTVCVFYHVVINSAYQCRNSDKTISEFKRWFDKECKRNNAEFLRMTAAYYYTEIMFIDKKWAEEYVIGFLNGSKCVDVIKIIMSCRGRFISDIDSQFVVSCNAVGKLYKKIKEDKNNSDLIETYISYIIAGRCYDYIDDSCYDELLEAVSRNDLKRIYYLLVCGINGIDDNKKEKVFNYTREFLYKRYGSNSNDAAIRSVAYNDVVSKKWWDQIYLMIQNTSYDEQLWGVIEECLRKTKRRNKTIFCVIKTLTSIANRSNDLSQFLINSIMVRLAKIGDTDSVTIVAQFMLNIKPSLYMKYVENPKAALYDFRDYDY